MREIQITQGIDERIEKINQLQKGATTMAKEKPKAKSGRVSVAPIKQPAEAADAAEQKRVKGGNYTLGGDGTKMPATGTDPDDGYGIGGAPNN
ncbi:MAG TPA: hypothetical protein VFD58_31890 [Blastocatellia bacterium]|nr:hypothetical protein [Blastocatellia bacterium]